MKFFRRRRIPDGSHQLFRDSVRYCIGHRIETKSRAEAQAVAQVLHGRFDVSIAPDTWDSIGSAWIVEAKHYGIPQGRDGEKTLLAARKAINLALAATGATGKYLGFERSEIGPADPPRRHHHDDDDADEDGMMGPPLPLRS
jgi:hypothetical protein